MCCRSGRPRTNDRMPVDTICVPTVRHSGSHFVVEGLLGRFQRRDVKQGAVGPGAYFDHLYPHKRALWEQLLGEYPAIAPLRHPVSVERSWLSRKMMVGEMIDEFRLMVEFSERYDFHFVPLDAEDRDKYITAINNDMGLDLKTNWGPVRSIYRNHELDWRKIEPSDDVANLLDEIGPFLQKFYPDTRRRG